MKIPKRSQPPAFMLLIDIRLLIQSESLMSMIGAGGRGERAFFRAALKLANGEAFPAFFASLCPRVGQ